MNRLINLINDRIIDHTNDSIKYYISKTKDKDKFMLHIKKNEYDTLNITRYNKVFFSKLLNMLFDLNKKTKNGCFNHENMADDDPIYNYTNQELLNKFFRVQYIVILIDSELNPLSHLCIYDNVIYSACTNIMYRNRGNMSLLLGVVLRMIQKNKLKINVDINNLKINVKKSNPIKYELIQYYKNFNFENYTQDSEYFIMKFKN